MLSDPYIPVLLGAALFGGAIGKMLRIPGGTLLAATVAVAFAGIYWDLSHTPPTALILVVQLLTGCMLGQSINRRFWHDITQIWRPILAVVLTFTLMAVPVVLLLVWRYGFDPLTALLASTPARMQDMIVLAGSLDSDAVTVMLMQLARQFAIIALTPLALMKYRKQSTAACTAAGENKRPRTPFFHRENAAAHAVLLIPGIFGAVVGHATGHILGTLLGAFFAVAASRIIWQRAGNMPFPATLTFLLQCLAGILLGIRITPDTGALLLERLAPFAITCLYVVAVGMLASRILVRRYHWHGGLSWLAASPGRTSEMLAMSQELDLAGNDRLALVCVHAVRQVYFTLLVSGLMAFL